MYGRADPSLDGVRRHSLAILALSAAGTRPAPQAVAWLSGQQCTDGGFMTFRADTAVPCDPAREDMAATATATQALAALGDSGTAVARAAGWIRSKQNEDGSFAAVPAPGAPGDTAATAHAVSALVAAGVDPDSVRSPGGRTPADALMARQTGCTAPDAVRGAFPPAAAVPPAPPTPVPGTGTPAGTGKPPAGGTGTARGTQTTPPAGTARTSETGQPGAGQPNAGQPGTGQAADGQPNAGQPGTGQPNAGQPGNTQPGNTQPGAGQPNAGQPGGSGVPGRGTTPPVAVAPPATAPGATPGAGTAPGTATDDVVTARAVLALAHGTLPAEAAPPTDVSGLTCPPGAAASPRQASAQAGAAWLIARSGPGGGDVGGPAGFEAAVNTVFALSATGHPAEAGAAADRLGADTVTLAGDDPARLASLILVADATGRPVSAYGGGDLLDRLEATGPKAVPTRDVVDQHNATDGPDDHTLRNTVLGVIAVLLFSALILGMRRGRE